MTTSDKPGCVALREKLAGRRVVASVSGGKDSAALSLWRAEQGIAKDVRAKTCAAKTIAPEPKANPLASSSGEGPRT